MQNEILHLLRIVINYLFEIFKIVCYSWQLLAFIVIIMFKKNIRDLLNAFIKKIENINKFKLGEMEIETIDEVVSEYEPSMQSNDNSDEYPLEMRFLKSWMDFEGNLKTKVENELDDKSQLHNTRYILNFLVNQGTITSAEKKVVVKILKYRNFLVHCENISIEDCELLSFVEFLNSMTVKINTIYEKKSNIIDYHY